MLANYNFPINSLSELLTSNLGTLYLHQCVIDDQYIRTKTCGVGCCWSSPPVHSPPFLAPAPWSQRGWSILRGRGPIHHTWGDQGQEVWWKMRGKGSLGPKGSTIPIETMLRSGLGFLAGPQKPRDGSTIAFLHVNDNHIHLTLQDNSEWYLLFQ